MKILIICRTCNGGGLNKATQVIKNNFYGDHNGHNGWKHAITDEEVQLLWQHGRLQASFNSIPTAHEVNKWSYDDRIGHDSVNAYLLVKFRAEKQGVFGVCEKCDGTGEVETEADKMLIDGVAEEKLDTFIPYSDPSSFDPHDRGRMGSLRSMKAFYGLQ